MPVLSQQAIDIGNREFLDAIFDDLRQDEYLWTAQFAASPKDAKFEQWNGLQVTKHYENKNQSHQDWNHYYCVASLKHTADGSAYRRKTHFSRLYVVVLDDATALQGLIEPTYVLETSSGKMQVGYRLATPLDDLDKATALHKALAAAGHLGLDPNGNNPVRYVRLPWGVNTKYAPPHPHRLLFWKPQQRIGVDDLVRGLGLTLQQVQTQHMAVIAPLDVSSPDGWIVKARKIAWDAARRTHDQPKLGRHDEIYRIGAYAARDGLPSDALEFILQEFVRCMRTTDTSGVETSVNWDTERKTIRDGYRQSLADGVPAPVDVTGLLAVRSKRDAEAFERITGMSIEEANRRVPEPVIKEDMPRIARGFPVGGLDELSQWVDSGASVVYPTLTQQTVLMIASAAVSRLYTTPQGDPLSLYLGCCGRSVGELRYTHHAVRGALSAAGMRRIVRHTRMTSPATIYKSLLRSPATVYLSDDYGGVAAFSRRQPSGLQEHALSLISSLHDGKDIQLDGPEDAGLRAGAGHVADEQPVIYAPCLGILALIGMDQLAVLMRASETGRGALQQMLLAVGDERTAIEQDPRQVAPPLWLANYLRRLRRLPPTDEPIDLSLSDIFSAQSGLPPQLVMIPFDGPLTGVYAMLDALSDDRRVKSLLLGARSTIRRIAAVLAAWASPDQPRVTDEILDWTASYVCDRMRETLEQFEVLHSVDGKSSVYDQTLARIVEAKGTGIANRDLVVGCWGYRNLSKEKRNELIGLMIEDEAITEVSHVNPMTKRRSKVFVATRFVEKETEHA